MKALLRKIRQILKDRKTRRIFTRLVSTVAAIVVFVTTYALVLPAITMEREAACGIEAHQHDQSCYTDVLVCEIPESPGHVHDESCYSTKQKQVCHIEEHVHDSDCYDENGELICEKTEHQHGEDCFEEVRELVCEMPESPGHQHDDSCYQKVLTCGKEVHTHSAACYHVDTASQAATEAIAVASTESAAAAATGNGLADNLNAPAEYSETETSPYSSAQNSVVEGSLDASPDKSLSEKGTTELTGEVSADEPGVGTSKEAAAVATTDISTSHGGTSNTSAPADATDTMSAEAGYVPLLDELNFNNLLNKYTGIYYSRLADADSTVDNETDGADAAANTGGTQEEVAAANTAETQEKEFDPGTKSGEKQEEAIAENTGEAHEAAIWNRIDKHTELKGSDNLRLYLAYTIPAGSLNETNQTARYRLPGNIHLTDEQIDTINTTVNGIAAQYVSYDTLEILDQEMYGKYLGIEAVEGTRTPSDDLNEYLANNGGQEFISATVNVENIYDENTGVLKAQDLVFTFAPYTIQKNQHQYDPEGKPTKAGEEVNGWLTIDVSPKQIDWEKADDETQTADIIFVEKDKKSDLKEISTELRLVKAEADSDTDTDAGKAANGEGSDAATKDNKLDGTRDSQAEDGTSDNTEKEPVSYPAVSFDDSITVSGGSLSTDTDAASGDAGMTAETEITVHVEADKDTFPEGTTMVLSAVSDEQMSTVAEAVEGAVDAPKTMGFHAVDISFRDAKGNEIEPLKPIRVSMTSDAIKRAVEDESTAPVVVHVSDPAADNTAAAKDVNTNDGDSQSTAVTGRNTDDGESEDTAKTDEGVNVRPVMKSSESTAGQSPASSPEIPEATIIETDTRTEEDHGDTLTFNAEAFSVYAIVYTVDFHWEVNGKTYHFSIPGGGFVSFEHLVDVLGIGVSDTKNNSDDTNEQEINENDAEETAEKAGEVRETSGTYDDFIELNEAEVSEAARIFATDVESIEFSDKELLWVGKVKEASTVSGLKEANNLEVEYSSDLTEEQIAKINTQSVEAGDWALISVQPFTSEENLTVTMKNGDQFVVKVTDAQISTHVISADGEDYVITVTYGPEAEIPDDARLTASEIAKGSFEFESYLKQSLEILGFYANEEEMGEETNEEPWKNNVPKARFFDIQILSEGKKIEPKSPVSVEIKYVGKENAYLGAMSVVHFADSGLEIINGTTSNQEDSTAVSFEQDSFSVTGTIINSANLSEDDYYILKEENGRWHALASDGGTVDVTDIYDSASSSVVNYQGAKNITWEVSFADSGTHGGEGWYFIKAKGEDKYISLNGTIVSGNPTSLYAQRTFWANNQGLWIHYYSEEDVYNPFSGAWRYKDHYHHFLSWSNGRFGVTKYNTQRDYRYYSDYYGDQFPSEFRFARVTGDSEVVNGNYPNNTYNEAQIQAWLDQAMTDKPLQDVNKKASIYDYDNRIYQIDFSARSGVTAMAADLSMAFVTDVSNSMLFPSSLTPVTAADFTNSYNTFSGDITMNTSDLDKLKHNNNEVYYAIGDRNASSTVYAIWYDSYWHAMDASYYARWKALGNSYYDSSRDFTISSRKKLHINDSTSTKYTIFNANSEYAQGIAHHNIYDMSDNGRYGLRPDGSITSYNMGNRLYYLESSVASAVNDMQIIAKEYPLGAVYAGLETFAMDVEETTTYLKIGGYDTNMNSAITSYKNNVQLLFNALKDIKGKDGTDQRDALDAVPYIGNGVTLPNRTNKFVILITDGAPNYCTKDEAISSANALKAAGYTIITVGLSTKDVSVAPEMLWKSASFVDPNVDIYSTDKSKPKYYYYAESGEDLKWILRDVVRKAMGQATVTSTVTDTIDPLFYPVDKDGNPFPQTSVSYIKKDGSKCSSNDPNRVGKVEYKNNNWVVTWDNQDILPGGWNTSLFVKAKEDFLGGNTASTNTEAALIPESYTTNKGKQNEKKAYFTDAQKIEKTSRPATPYVNVDELKMTSNSNNFIVYLGEEVTPKEEIKKLWDSIVINTVVDQNGMNNNYTIKTSGDMYYDPNRPNKLTQDQNPLNANNDPVTEIPLSHYIPNSDAVINSLLTSLKDGNTQTTVSSEPFDYAPYGQSKMGTITVTLTKKVNEEAKASAPDKHETKKVQNPAEEYVLTIEYKPLTGSERKDLLVNAGIVDPEDQGYMHNGDNGAGKELNETDDQVKSANTHKVIVCAKGLKITKTDFDFSNILKGAKFELYRTARTGEQNQTDLTSVTGKYIKVADLDTSTDGFAIKDELPILKENEAYYLVETEAPDGYIMLDYPIQVKLEIEKQYYTPDRNETYIRNNEGTSSPETTLYSMVERSKLTLADDPAVRRTNYDGTGDLTHVGLDYDIDTITTMFYSISNNPGVELPATGGPGTTLIYLFGIMLTGVAGAGLVMRRRRKAA